MRITYGITVCNEATELNNLLSCLLDLIDNEDEVRKQMERHIISPDLFIDSMKSIKEKMEFQK